MSTDNNKPKTTKQKLALTGVVLIVIMVIATLLTAIFDPTGKYFRSCLIVTIALPIALWVFLWAYGAMMHKHTPASFDLDLGIPADEDEAGETAAGEAQAGETAAGEDKTDEQ